MEKSGGITHLPSSPLPLSLFIRAHWSGRITSMILRSRRPAARVPAGGRAAPRNQSGQRGHHPSTGRERVRLRGGEGRAVRHDSISFLQHTVSIGGWLRWWLDRSRIPSTLHRNFGKFLCHGRFEVGGVEGEAVAHDNTSKMWEREREREREGAASTRPAGTSDIQ